MTTVNWTIASFFFLLFFILFLQSSLSHFFFCFTILSFSYYSILPLWSLFIRFMLLLFTRSKALTYVLIDHFLNLIVSFLAKKKKKNSERENSPHKKLTSTHWCFFSNLYINLFRFLSFCCFLMCIVQMKCMCIILFYFFQYYFLS